MTELSTQQLQCGCCLELLRAILFVLPGLLGPACFVAILAFILVAFTLFYYISKNTYVIQYLIKSSCSPPTLLKLLCIIFRFFRYYSEGKRSRPCEILSVEQSVEEVDRISYKAIFRKSWTYLLVGYINYATTLTVFPAITSLGDN